MKSIRAVNVVAFGSLAGLELAGAVVVVRFVALISTTDAAVAFLKDIIKVKFNVS